LLACFTAKTRAAGFWQAILLACNPLLLLGCCFTFLSADWTVHKKYCKRLVYVKKSELGAFVASTKKADPGSSAAYQAALQAAADDSARSLVLVTAIVAQKFAKVSLVLVVHDIGGWHGMRIGTVPQQQKKKKQAFAIGWQSSSWSCLC
jgi:hypothetical protein